MSVSTEEMTGWSGLPLILCPSCRNERVIERTSINGKQENYGKVFFKCQSCGYFMWQDTYKKQLVKACQELEILRSENAELRSIVANQQVQIQALVMQSISGNLEGGNQEDEDFEANEDSDAVAEAFYSNCRLEDVANGRSDPSEGGLPYDCNCDCPSDCEPGCECILYHPRSP